MGAFKNTILYNFFKISVQFVYVPGAGIEPARFASSVFETDASTCSAIRA